MLILSRIKWESETVLRIVNESNIECFFEIRTRDPSDRDPTARYLHLLSAAKIDNLHENFEKLDSPHLLSDRTSLAPRDVLERLIRINQKYKTTLVHSLNLHDESHNLLSKLNRIDYLQKWGDRSASFDVE